MGGKVDESEDHVDDVDDQDECQFEDDSVDGHYESSRGFDVKGLDQDNKQKVLFLSDCHGIKENNKASQQNCADKKLPRQLPPTHGFTFLSLYFLLLWDFVACLFVDLIN